MHPHLKIILETERKLRSPENKVSIGKLKMGDLVKVLTFNTCYTIRVIDPEEDLVEATSNGKHIQCPGKFRVLGPIVAGHSLFLEAIERDESDMVRTIHTSSVQRITINGQEIP